MKIFALATLATSAHSMGFNHLILGGESDAGTVTYEQREHVLVITRPKPEDGTCGDLSTSFTVYPNPYSVNDWETPGDDEKSFCQPASLWNVAMPMSWSGTNEDFDELEAGTCVSTTVISDGLASHMYEFATLATDDGNCVTLTKSKLAYATESNPDGIIRFYRSYCKMRMAFHPSFNTANFPDDQDWTYEVSTYGKGNCNGGWIKTYDVTQSDHQAWVSLDMDYGNYRRVLSAKINGQCYSFRRGGVNWHKAGKKIIMDDERTKSFKMTMVQDNIFVPTCYMFSYNRDDSEFDINNLPGGYHIHESKVPANGDCAATGGHWNPYGEVGPWDSAETNYDYETGDLARRYGATADNTVWIKSMDFNLPLHGANKVNDMSIVFHRNDDNSRYVCYNLAPARYSQRMGGYM